MRLTANHLKVIRAQIAHGQACDRHIESFDMVPAINYQVFLHAPYGDDKVFLSLTDPVTKRGAVMEINRAFVNDLNRSFDSAMGAAILIQRGDKASGKA